MSLISQAEYTAWFQSSKNVTLTSAQLTFLATIVPWVEAAIYQTIGYTLEQATYTEFLPSTGGERPPLEFGIDIGWDRIGSVVMPRNRMDPSSGMLQLSNLPARSITSVYENMAAWTAGTDDGDWPSTSLLDASAYRLDKDAPGISKNGRLIRTVGGWPSTPRVVKVTYVAGYTALEISTNYGQIKLAAFESLGWWWGKAMRRSAGSKANGLTAMQLAIRDFSATFGDPSMIGQTPGVWAQNVLSPEALNILMPFVNMRKYLGG